MVKLTKLCFVSGNLSGEEKQGYTYAPNTLHTPSILRALSTLRNASTESNVVLAAETLRVLGV